MPIYIIIILLFIKVCYETARKKPKIISYRMEKIEEMKSEGVERKTQRREWRV
jgi:hypothetical protein